ncbi:MAG TPA: PaaI family thioesterase [Longimicrobium sp.]|nr:PaaI family thioesterase [Longimicrobium sp.]
MTDTTAPPAASAEPAASPAPPRTMLAHMQAMLSGEIPAPPAAKLIGFTMDSIEPGHAVFSMQADERHANPMGTLHGGILCDLADAAMGCAWGSTLGPGESYTTVELKINFMRPVWRATLTAEGRVIGGGRTVGLTECRVTDEQGRLVAHATSTLLTLRGDAAQGR